MFRFHRGVKKLTLGLCGAAAGSERGVQYRGLRWGAGALHRVRGGSCGPGTKTLLAIY